jgi:selenoprotein W-related protein
MSDADGKPRVEIEYCTQCRWLLRAAWTAQELLTTFSDELGEVALRPGTGGVFRVSLNGETLADRAADRGFPDLPLLKQAIRDRIAPQRDLGHSERKPQT